MQNQPTKTVMVLGASGNFGSKIADVLSNMHIPLILVGRREQQLNLLKSKMLQRDAKALVSIAIVDVNKDIDNLLSSLKPFIVINTCGPFQSADYRIVTACISHDIHYIDLADSRDFVNHIEQFNLDAIAHHCLVVSGASTVPCLSDAVLMHYQSEFSHIESVTFGITPGQKAERGLATTQAILSYSGKPIAPFSGQKKQQYGWQNVYRQTYPILGKRWMANCDIPDLDLLPKKYHLQSIQFSAGMENSFLHFGIWGLSWLVRLGVPLKLEKHATWLLKLSHFFDYFGTDAGGMHMIISGKDQHGKQKQINWFIVAKSGHGPHIPTIPAIVLAKKLVNGELHITGAMPCMGLVSLDEYLLALKNYDISVHVDETIPK